MTEGPFTLTIKRACEASGLSRSTIYEAMGKGALPALKVGRRTLVRRADLERWLDAMPNAQIGQRRPS